MPRVCTMPSPSVLFLQVTETINAYHAHLSKSNPEAVAKLDLLLAVRRMSTLPVKEQPVAAFEIATRQLSQLITSDVEKEALPQQLLVAAGACITDLAYAF